MAKRKKLEEVCFPIPEDASLSVQQSVDENACLKGHIFQQTVQTAYQISIPYSFTSEYSRERPYKLTTEEQTETVLSLFRALQPKDAVELALAQQFIVTHIQAINSVKNGIGEKDIKKFELTHQILETLTKYRTRGAQLINVQYNLNQGQIVNIKGAQRGADESVTLDGELK